jgi:predicted methyltransferase
MGDVYIREIALPPTIEAVVQIDIDDDYNIYVNNSICEEKKKLAIAHEMKHIKNNHFYDDYNVALNEIEAVQAEIMLKRKVAHY